MGCRCPPAVWSMRVFACLHLWASPSWNRSEKLILICKFLSSWCHHLHILFFLIHPKMTNTPPPPLPSKLLLLLLQSMQITFAEQLSLNKTGGCCSSCGGHESGSLGGRLGSGTEAWTHAAHTHPNKSLLIPLSKLSRDVLTGWRGWSRCAPVSYAAVNTMILHKKNFIMILAGTVCRAKPWNTCNMQHCDSCCFSLKASYACFWKLLQLQIMSSLYKIKWEVNLPESHKV